MFFSAVFAIVSAMVGAGFASGREIMHFFSRYGLLSWPLTVLGAAFMGWLMKELMDGGAEINSLFPKGKLQMAGKALLLLLYTAVGGAMTAAAGELAALTVPLFHARSLGGLLTLCACAALSRRSLLFLSGIGKVLFLLMLLAFFLCFRVPAEETPFSAPSVGTALLQLPGYCGLNVLLSAGVLKEIGKKYSANENRKIAVYSSIMIGLLLMAANFALLPHAETLQNAALPVVMLLKHYGKAGFYLSALVLYLAVVTTLIAILQGMRGLLNGSGWAAWFLCAVASLVGFSGIVGAAYPVLGWLGVGLILKKRFPRAGTNCFSCSFLGRKPTKEEGNP